MSGISATDDGDLFHSLDQVMTEQCFSQLIMQETVSFARVPDWKRGQQNNVARSILLYFIKLLYEKRFHLIDD